MLLDLRYPSGFGTVTLITLKSHNRNNSVLCEAAREAQSHSPCSQNRSNPKQYFLEMTCVVRLSSELVVRDALMKQMGFSLGTLLPSPLPLFPPTLTGVNQEWSRLCWLAVSQDNSSKSSSKAQHIEPPSRPHFLTGSSDASDMKDKKVRKDLVTHSGHGLLRLSPVQRALLKSLRRLHHYLGGTAPTLQMKKLQQRERSSHLPMTTHQGLAELDSKPGSQPLHEARRPLLAVPSWG